MKSLQRKLARLARRIPVLSLLLATSLPLAAEDWVDTGHNEPDKLYIEKCGMCHLANGMGTTLLARRFDAEQALLANRRDLQPEFIRNAVRNGFNNMFPISRGEVSDAQLEKIISHLTEESR